MGNPYNFGLFMTHCCLSGILFMTHCRFLGGFLWRILYLTHLIYHAYWIFCAICYICVVFFTWFLCNIYKICRQFYWVFVQFLGVIKCLNNPFFTICRIAHTKKPHRAKFWVIHIHHLKFSVVSIWKNLKPLQGSTTLHR